MGEGYWGLAEESQASWDDTKNLWDQANAEFRTATSLPGAKAMAKVRWGMLLEERFNTDVRIRATCSTKRCSRSREMPGPILG